MSARTPLVSILVPAYNAARFLPGLCQSIQAQTYPNYEVLIGDDGSTDNTASVVAPFLKDNRFQLLGWRENKGANTGLMILCSSMRGDYWCGTGADDLFYPSFLEKRVELMESNPSAFMVHGLADVINESGGFVQNYPRIVPDLPRELSAPRCLEVLLQHDVIIAPSAMLRTNVTRQVQPFFHWNWLFTQDWFLWILHAATGSDLVWDPRVLNRYRVHAGSMSRALEKDNLRRADVRLTPLVALRTAAQFSHWAALTWSRWGRTLYWRWLRQAAALKARRGLKDEWMQVGAHAYYGGRGRRVSLLGRIGEAFVGSGRGQPGSPPRCQTAELPGVRPGAD